jgi:hypothetical protein
MLTIIIDILGAYWVTRKTNKYPYLILWSLVIGIANSFGTNYFLYKINSGIFSIEATAFGAVFGVFIHPIICFLSMLFFRSRQKKSDYHNDIEIADATNTKIHDDYTVKRKIIKPKDNNITQNNANTGLIIFLLIIAIIIGLVFIANNYVGFMKTQELTSVQIENIDGRGKVQKYNFSYAYDYYFSANVYNGNDNIKITTLEVKITTMVANIREERVYIDSVEIEPLSIGDIDIAIIPFDEEQTKSVFSWSLVGGTGIVIK